MLSLAVHIAFVLKPFVVPRVPFLTLFLNALSRLLREHTHRRTMGAGDKRGGRGKEKKKKVENRDIRRSVEGRGMGQATGGKQDGHYRDFQVFTRQGLS